MLVLTRKVGESVILGGGIVVTVVQVKNNQVRLGFQAPDKVGIYREELLASLTAPSIDVPAPSGV